jgi:hypothetical protein
LVKKISVWGLVALLGVLLSGCLIETVPPSPTPVRVPPTPTSASGPTPEGNRVRYGCEDPWYLEPTDVAPKITNREAEVRMRAFLQERGPHEAAELIEVHYGTWVEEDEEGEDPALGSSDARSLQHRAVWLLVFRWRPSPGPEITPPPGFAYRLHGLVDAQTGEPLSGCSELMRTQGLGVRGEGLVASNKWPAALH